jgi:ferredoxin
MRIEIDSETCTGHGRCYTLAPDLVEPDDEGRGVVIQEVVPSHLEPQAHSAAANCPERAVTLRE